MSALYQLVWSLAGIVMIVAGFVYMFNPQKGTDILKRLLVVLILLPLGICFLYQYIQMLMGSFSTVFLLVAISVVAYFIWQHRFTPHKPERKALRPERTPVVPHREEEE